jgi:hypothetical protein
MNINRNEVSAAISGEQTLTICDAILRGFKANESSGRAASVTVNYKIKRDKDAPNVAVLIATIKAREPKGARIEITAKSDDAELMRVKVNEEQGQQKIIDNQE